MALDTYTGLKATIANYLSRSDLTAIIPDFITLGEAKLNKIVRSRDMVARATATIDAEYETAPTDYVEMISLFLLTNPKTQVEFVSAANFSRVSPSGSGKPRFFTVVGDQLRFGPVPDGAYEAEMQYYAKLPALSVSNASNWLLASNPDAYLYAAMLEAVSYARNDAQIAKWGTLLTQVVDMINKDNASAVFNSAPLTMRAG